MAKEITRHIKPEVERELWARAAGRCQFNGCNRLIYKSSITQERVNISEKAHIYSFSEDGPRGWGPFVLNKNNLNNIKNLMLMCHDCHKTIDQDKDGVRYSAELLIKWKNQHEQRIRMVTGISPDNKSHVVMYGANIGEQRYALQYVEAVEAMFPNKYPADEKAVNLSMSCEHEDSTPEYWNTEKNHLEGIFQKQIEPRIRENDPAHFSLFSQAPIPLLIQLGALFTDKVPVDVYQPIREPMTWKWQTYPDDFHFIVNEPIKIMNIPALVISLSGKIYPDRIISVIGEDVSIWELTVEKKFLHNDFIRSQAQLSQFREKVRKLMVAISKTHGQSTPLHIFPAMPVSCAVELGRTRMPKSDMPWVIYDQINKVNKFVMAITVKGD